MMLTHIFVQARKVATSHNCKAPLSDSTILLGTGASCGTRGNSPSYRSIKVINPEKSRSSVSYILKMLMI